MSVCSCKIVADNTDDTCVDVVVAGQGSLAVPYKISAHPIISSDANNKLECRPTGLFVPSVSVKVDTVTTDCLDLEIAGTGTVADPFIISGTPILNPACPQIKCGPDGLCVDVEVQPLDTGTVDMHVTGTGAAGDPFIVSADANVPTNVVAIDNAQNINAVVGPSDTITFTCVPVPVASNDPTCLSITGDTCNGLVFDLNISPDPCNGFQCHANGLFAFHDPSLTPAEPSDCANFNFPGPFNGTFIDTVVGAPFCVTLNNPSACSGLVALMRMSGVVNIQRTSGMFVLGFQISTAGLGGPWNTTAQAGIYNSGAPMGTRQTLIWPGAEVLIPPGGNKQVCARLVVSGTATVNGIIANSDRCLGIVPLSYVG